MGEPNEPCGSWRVIREFEGYDQQTVWCERREGPCPWPGTRETKESERICADSPTRRLRVTWAETAVQDAYDTVHDVWVSLNGLPPARYELNRSHEQAIAIAKDALVACGAEEAEPAGDVQG